MKTSMKFKLSPLAVFVGLALSSSLAYSADAEQDVTAVKKDDKTEKIQVLGSYIKGADTITANPVSVVNADDMKYSGAVDTTDLVNILPINSGAENRPDTFTSFYNQGTSNVNLRGLGLSSTLVLINGKRQVLSGAKAQDGSVFVDTSSIPAIALKRVEVLKEGAAASYGSDAIAGVVNFVTNDTFEGVKIDGAYHTIEGFDQNDKNISILSGMKLSDNTNIVFAASMLRRSNMQGWERPDLVKNAASSLGTGFKLTGDSVVTSGPWAGTYAEGEQVGNPNCAGVNGNILDLDGDGDIDRCGFKYGLHYNIVNEEEREQYYTSLTHFFGNDIKLNVSAFYSDYRIIDNFSVPSLPNLSFPVVSADNSTNPFGVDAIIFGRHNPTVADFSKSRAAPRDNKTFRLETSLSGYLDNGWEWVTSLAYSGNTYKISQPEMSLSRLALAMNGQGGVSGDMTFDHFSTDLNHDPALLDWLETDFKSETTTRLLVWDGVINGELFELDGGTVYGAFGAQYRRESYQVNPAENSTILYNAAGNPLPNDFTFLGSVNNIDESRSAAAIFAEIELPISDDITVNAALRYENLDTDSSLDPKISVLYSATENLSLRASASTSFREPSLSQFNADVTNTVNLVDYQLNPDGTPVLDSSGNKIPNASSLFIRQTTTGNADLKPEEATNYNVGALWSSDAFQVRLDYWRIDYKDVITIESAQAVLDQDPNGPTIVRQDPNDPSSTLAGISTDYFNAATIDASGIDIETSYRFDLDGSSLELSAGFSRYLSYDVPNADGSTYDAVGKFNFGSFVRSMPEDKGNISAHWLMDNHSVMARVDYVSSYINNRQGDTIDAFTPVELQYRFVTAIQEGEAAFSVGVQNLFDRAAPVVADGANFSYDPKHHDPRGRIFYAKASYTF